jgi:hypothetical protein
MNGDSPIPRRYHVLARISEETAGRFGVLSRPGRLFNPFASANICVCLRAIAYPRLRIATCRRNRQTVRQTRVIRAKGNAGGRSPPA